LQYFSNAQLLEVADAGHWTYHDQPKVVAQMLQGFIEKSEN
jgi:pimeloyl-ACP methyl ester carboxylesterase